MTQEQWNFGVLELVPFSHTDGGKNMTQEQWNFGILGSYELVPFSHTDRGKNIAQKIMELLDPGQL